MRDKTKTAGLLACGLVMLVVMAACGESSITTIPGNISSEQATSTAAAGSNATATVGLVLATDTPAPTATSLPVATSAPITTTTPVGGSQGGGSQTIPAYPNLRAADLGLPLELRLAGLPAGSARPTNVRFFTTNNSFEDVVSYYDRELPNVGYGKAGRQNLATLGGIRLNSGSVVGYNRTDKSARQISLINAGIINQNFFAQLSTAELNSVRLNLGDRLVILFDNVPVGLG